jgi:hypothetical protein
VVRQLLDAGLLDELHLFVHPAAAGSGLRLFEEGGPPRHLRLISSQPFRTGVVYLVYGPDPTRRRAPTTTPRRACPNSELDNVAPAGSAWSRSSAWCSTCRTLAGWSADRAATSDRRIDAAPTADAGARLTSTS